MRFVRTTALAFAAAIATANAKPPQPRSHIDVCANVDDFLEINNVVLGKLELCLCASAIPVFLKTNLVLQSAVLLFGKSTVTTALTALINQAYDRQECHFPEHAVSQCSTNPCNFDCKDGFTPHPPSHPTECKCKPPNTVCNGVCGYYPACASQRAKRDTIWRATVCPHGWSACGIWGKSGDYECVDVASDLWSCGGCELPLSPADPTGVDCTAISDVHDVACVSGRCAVQRCKDGFHVSANKTACVPTAMHKIPRPALAINNGAGPFKA